MKRLGKMKQTRMYEVPECELLELKLEEGLLYDTQKDAVTVQSYNLDAGQWDER